MATALARVYRAASTAGAWLGLRAASASAAATTSAAAAATTTTTGTGANKKTGGKKRVVVLGTGWSSFALAKGLNPDAFDITVVSPRNHMLFTPLLASTSVGTLEFRSISEPVKHAMPHVTYTRGEATAVNAAAGTVSVTSSTRLTKAGGVMEALSQTVPYDVLVVGVGARNNTFGIPGVEEHMFFLKELEDAREIRRRIVRNVELAGLTPLPAAERRRLLSFVIVGGGPTGVEFAAELHDFIMEDVVKVYPDILPDLSITIVEGNRILGAFDSSLREYAEKKFARDRIKVRMGANVVRVEKDRVHLSDGDSLPYGLGIWNTGIGPRPLVSGDTTTFVKDKWGHICTDDHLRVLRPPATGADAGADDTHPGMFACGDCATVGSNKYAATAQVAEQQGSYLAATLNAAAAGTGPGGAEPFKYHHRGSLAFLGSFRAVSDFTQLSDTSTPMYGAKLRGPAAWFLWRTAYLTKLGSWRNRLQVPVDWTRTLLFGRDTTLF